MNLENFYIIFFSYAKIAYSKIYKEKLQNNIRINHIILNIMNKIKFLELIL